MKILFLSDNLDNWVASTLYSEQRAILNRLPQSVMVGPGFDGYRTASAAEIVRDRFGGRTPDAIFCYVNERRLLGEPMPEAVARRYGVPEGLRVFPTGLKDVSVPKIAWINDFWHCTRDEWDRILLDNGFSAAFCTYCPPFVSRQTFDAFFSERVQSRVRFIPWPRAINPDIFRPYDLPKTHDVTLLGAMNPSFYPLRCRMHEVFSRQPDIRYFHQPHPGYQFCDPAKPALTGTEYARCIAQSRIFAGCTGKYQIPFIKLYEGLACQAALMCDTPSGAEHLGLTAYENYLPVTEHNFLQTAQYYAADAAALQQIAQNGRRLFLALHTVDIRAQEFVETLAALLGGGTARHWAELSPNKKDVSVSVCLPRKPETVRHITDVARPADAAAYQAWYRYGTNQRPRENPPVVTEYPELVMLRGVYLRQLAEQLQARTFAEVGTARGYQSFMWARYRNENNIKDGMIFTCDVDPADKPIYKTPVTGQAVLSRRQVWAQAPEARFVRFVDGDSAVLAGALDRPVDMLYIDGKHTEEAVRYDFRHLKSRLHAGSVVIFDDCDERFEGVQRAAREIAADCGLELEFISFTPSQYKIAMMAFTPQGLRRIQDRQAVHQSAGTSPQTGAGSKTQKTVSMPVGAVSAGSQGSLESAKKPLEVNVSAAAKHKILFIVDKPGWAHDFKTDSLIRCLDDEFDSRKVFCDRVQAADIEWADLVLIYYWRQFRFEQMQRLLPVFQTHRHKILMGICSHHELQAPQRQQGLALIKSLAAGVFVNSMLLFREFEKHFDTPVFYTPNGVDTAFFTPTSQRATHDILTVGWAGSLTNHGDNRGYHDIIVPAVQSLDGVRLMTAARENQYRDRSQMLAFYRDLDVYVCASAAEGTPNPCLEAAACGVPVVTTAVGNMPELIEPGVNGYFVRRDINDLADKLRLLQQNSSLLNVLRTNARRSIEEWDWRRQAENYRYMLRAMPASGSTQVLFNSPHQVYLASADRMDSVLENLKALHKLPQKCVDTYVSVIGGLSGLNYLAALNPHKIVFFDLNANALNYARLIVELIKMSTNRRDFISRVFGRSVQAFLSGSGNAELTEGNQDRYLSGPVDASLVQDTLSRLSKTLRQTYRTYLLPHHQNRVLDGVRNCRRLLPCFDIHQCVPVGGGKALGYNEQKQLVPNTNTFFYGHGWLGDDATFMDIRAKLSALPISYVPFDLMNGRLDVLADFSGRVVLHASNIDDWCKDHWVSRRNRLFERTLIGQGDLTVVTTFGGVVRSQADPHQKAFQAVAPYVYGRVVEVTHKTPWGFHEFNRRNILYSEYLNGSDPADTTIVHILVGEGLSVDVFNAVCRKALSQSRRVLVLEHNRDASDWTPQKADGFLSIQECRAKLDTIARQAGAQLSAAKPVAGQQDLARNVLFVLDVPGRRVEGSAEPDAMACFQNAQAAYANGDVDAAQEMIRQYRRTMHYDRLPVCRHPHTQADPLMSVIVVTWNRPQDVEHCLKVLRSQPFSGDYEIILVDNGATRAERAAELADVVIDCPINFNLSEGRNIGAHFARGQILVLLDDDAIPGPNYLDSIRRAFEQYDIVGLRGRAFAKTQNPGLPSPAVYNLGDTPMAAFCDQEGNAAFRRKMWLTMGGMDPLLFGHEGSDLSYRIAKSCSTVQKVIYWPDTVIYHDYGDPDKRQTKQNQYERNRQYLYQKHGVDVTILNTPIKKQKLPPLGRRVSEPKQSATRTDAVLQAQSAASPKVSVIIACRNEQAYLAECLNSLLAQTLTDWELLIVDDGSTDGTPDILAAYAARDSRIRVWRFDDSKGPYVRRNFAIGQARAPFISIQDADDIMMPDKLAVLYAHISRDETLGLVGSWFRRFLDSIPGLDFGDSVQLPTQHAQMLELANRTIDMCWHGSAIIRTSLFDRIGLYDENPWSSDSFWLAKAGLYSLLTKAVRYENIPQVLTLKREHAGSQTGSISPLDPRSRRRRLCLHFLEKLRKIDAAFRTDPAMDVAAALRDCSISDFIPTFGHLFESWESAPVTDEMGEQTFAKACDKFRSGEYVFALQYLNLLERLTPSVGQRFADFHPLRALALYAAGHDREAECERNRVASDRLAGFTLDYSLDAVARKQQVAALLQPSASVPAIPAKTAPLVSVMMPAYNAAAYIGAAVKSVLAQRFEGFEFLIVDDGSTDDTAAIVKGFSDSRIRLIQQPHRCAAAATNRAIREARGRFVMTVDSDDMLEPDFLTQMVRCAQDHPQYDYYYPAVLKLMDAEGRLSESVWEYSDYEDASLLPAFLFVNGFLPIPHPGSLKRRSMYERTGLYRELDGTEDFEFMTRNALKIRFKRAADANGYRYRLRPDSVSRRMPRRNQITAAALETMLGQYPAEVLCPPLRQESPDCRQERFIRYAVGNFENYAKRHVDAGGEYYQQAAQRLWQQYNSQQFKDRINAARQTPLEAGLTS